LIWGAAVRYRSLGTWLRSAPTSVWLVVVLLLALAARLPALGQHGLWIDEGNTYIRSILPLDLVLENLLMVRNQVPLYYLLMRLWTALLALCRGARHHLLEIAACFVVLLVIPWGLFWVANLRGFDSLSVFVTVAVMGYLCVPWWGGDQRIRLARASSSSQEEGV